MRIAKGTLLGIRRLRTLLETTTVGDTAKNAGNELGVVHKTEAVKQCVLLAEIDVQPGIKRVAMLIELGGIGEIARNPSTGRQGIELQELDGIWVQSPGREMVRNASAHCKVRGSGATAAEWVANEPAGHRS